MLYISPDDWDRLFPIAAPDDVVANLIQKNHLRSRVTDTGRCAIVSYVDHYCAANDDYLDDFVLVISFEFEEDAISFKLTYL